MTETDQATPVKSADRIQVLDILHGAGLWLKYFNFGPFEWVWRSLTYLKAQPFVAKR